MKIFLPHDKLTPSCHSKINNLAGNNNHTHTSFLLFLFLNIPQKLFFVNTYFFTIYCVHPFIFFYTLIIYPYNVSQNILHNINVSQILFQYIVVKMFHVKHYIVVRVSKNEMFHVKHFIFAVMPYNVCSCIIFYI